MRGVVMTPSDDRDLVGQLIQARNGFGRIVIASRLLDVALVEMIGDDGLPNGESALLHTLEGLCPAVLH